MKTPGKSKKKGGKRKKGKASSKKKHTKPTKAIIDIMSVAAMENLYYIAHNAPAALVVRGFKRLK